MEITHAGMAQYRQSGIERYFSHHGGDGAGSGVGGVGSSNGGALDQVAIRIPHKTGRIRRGRHDKALRKFSVPCIAFVLFLGLLVTLFAFHFLSPDKDLRGRFGDNEEPHSELKHGITLGLHHGYNHSTPSRELRFGRGSISGGRDSRYWDTDDRRRDDEYDEDVLELPGITSGDDHKPNDHKNKEKKTTSGNVEQKPGGLYNEAGRDELHKFEEEYKESLKDASQSRDQANDAGDANLIDEYDDGIDIEDSFGEGADEPEHDEEDHPARDKHPGSHVLVETAGGGTESNGFRKDISAVSFRSGSTKMRERGQSGVKADAHSGKSLATEKKAISKGKSKRRKHSGSCEMKLLNSSQLLEPLVTKKFSRFSLRYTEVEDKPVGVDSWEPRFSGHQTLQEREMSFYARDQTINCGFVKSPKGLPSTGFDLAEDDIKFMGSCHVAVSSCIFGNSDHLRTPYNKMITRMSRKNVCFVMFVDEQTLQTLSAEGQKPDSMGFVGLWKVVVVKNLPYDDMRRVGKIPKFLTHRLFPSAR